MEKFLIVNADDFGLTPGVVTGIRQAHQHGIVTSTTVMMNWPDSAPAIQDALQGCPDLGLGAHLVLTAGKPLLPPDHVPSLVDRDGNFYRQGPFIAHLAEVKPDEAYAEWQAQIEAFVDAAGRAPDHLDSHHHASYYTPALLEAMLSLAAVYGCPIRKPFGENSAIYAGYLSCKASEPYDQAVEALLDRFNPCVTDVFIDSFYDEGATLDNLKAVIQTIAANPTHSTFELMCHPAVVDESLLQLSSYNNQRGTEIGILQSDEVITLLRQLDIHLVNFSALKQM